MAVAACAALTACGTRPAGDTGPDQPSDPWAKSGIDWSAPPAPGPPPAWRPPAHSSFRLANGVRVVVLPNRRLPLVSVQVVNPLGGSANDPRGHAGLAGLTADLLDEGAGERSALALTGELERLGARLDTGVGADSAAISLDILADTLEPGLALLADVLARPRFEPADFDRIKAERVSRIALRRDRPQQVAALVFDRQLFGDHPYGWPALGMADTAAAIELSDVRTFYVRHYDPANIAVVVAGDVDPAALERALADTVGAWRRPDDAPKTRPIAPPAPLEAPRLVVVDKPGAEQTVVRIGRVAMPRHDSRYHLARTVNTVLGGSFAARLNNRLREQLGYTYGAYSRHWMGRASGTWSIVTSLETKVTVAGVREALALVAALGAGDVPAAEIDKAAALRVGRLQQRFGTNAEVAAAYADLTAFGLPLSWYEGYTDAAAGVTAAQLRQFAAERWRAGALTVVAVGDLSRIHAGLRELLGASVECSPEGEVLRTHTAR